MTNKHLSIIYLHDIFQKVDTLTTTQERDGREGIGEYNSSYFPYVYYARRLAKRCYQTETFQKWKRQKISYRNLKRRVGQTVNQHVSPRTLSGAVSDSPGVHLLCKDAP